MRAKGATLWVGLAVLIAPAPASSRSLKGWEDASTIGRDALVVAALGMPAVQGDWAGDIQAGEAIGATFLATTALKQALPERRPDGSDRKSFPSGHAGTAFSAAATLQNRYGWQVGLPAQLVAAFVGFSRVEARKHHWYDVVAGDRGGSRLPSHVQAGSGCPGRALGRRARGGRGDRNALLVADARAR
jgi:membrane-associated phospholipid phosphatase